MKPWLRFLTEKVHESYEPRPGVTATREFWIAYPTHVVAYVHMEDRISRSLGRGHTRQEALESARRTEVA